MRCNGGCFFSCIFRVPSSRLFVSRHGGRPIGRTRRGATGGGACLQARRRFDADESRNAIAAMLGFRGRALAQYIPASAVRNQGPNSKQQEFPSFEDHECTLSARPLQQRGHTPIMPLRRREPMDCFGLCRRVGAGMTRCLPTTHRR